MSRQRDPPGQRCVYITPGDPHQEAYRLTTFNKFPQTAPVNPTVLASVGFYYTGYKDRVKCFSCGLCVENWKFGDDVKLARWHKPDCHMSNHVPRNGNIPLQLGTPPHRIVNTGIGPSGNVYNNTTRPQGTGVERPQPPRRPETLRNFCDSFPSGNPAYPSLRNQESRLETFDHRWQSRISANPRQLSRAGFFYLGERDQVKCWYCNGGLQNWDKEDEPWTEHAKWFPTCEFLLQRKGPEFVHRIVSMYPNLPRPTLARQNSNQLTPLRQNELYAIRNEVVSALYAYLEDLVQESLRVRETSRKYYIRNQLQQALCSNGNIPPERKPYYLALLSVCNFSLAQFDEVMVSEKTDADLNPKLLMTMAFLLANPNMVSDLMFDVPEDHWFKTKIESFQQFLWDLSTSHPELYSLVETCRSILRRVASCAISNTKVVALDVGQMS